MIDLRQHKDLRDAGWAPGNYQIRCIDCQQVVDGCDKRACRCRTCAEKRLAEHRPSNPSDKIVPFQRRVIEWMMETFSMEVCRNTAERNHRFLEEALELVQAMGCAVGEAHMLVDYVYGRKVGEPEQEIGGVMVTLAALCAAADLSMQTCGDTELDRCWRNIARIRAKQATKPSSSPLPGRAPDETSGELEQLRRIDQAARAFVNALPEDMTFRGAQRKFAALCDALFDQIPQREGDNRDVSAERCRNAATVPETSGSYSYSDPSADARTPAGAGIASPPVYRPPLDEFLVCGQFETDPRSAFCLKCGYPRRDHRGAVKANEAQK